MSATFTAPLCPHKPSRTATSTVVEIGAIPILLESRDARFCNLLNARYAGFVGRPEIAAYRFDIQLDSSGNPSDEDVQVSRSGSLWHFRRGDFQASWDARSGRGQLRQCPNPYSIDTVLRITHSLVLAGQGGFLVHAASAVRGGAAYLFAGVSGAGKTTMARLAPPDTVVLTDEISYVRRFGGGYRAYGTPFAGELARSGTNTSAPIAALHLLEQGPENRIVPVAAADAARSLMRHVLFFAQEEEMVACVLDSVLDFVSQVEVSRLIFTPDSRAWELLPAEPAVLESAHE